MKLWSQLASSGPVAVKSSPATSNRECLTYCNKLVTATFDFICLTNHLTQSRMMDSPSVDLTSLRVNFEDRKWLKLWLSLEEGNEE